MFTLLDRYIGRKLLEYFLLGIVIFTLVLFFSDALLDFMKDLQHYGIPGDIALTIVGLQIPRIVAIVIPMSILLSTLLVYNNLNNHFEIIAMRMSGISLFRLSRPAIIMGIMASVLTFVLHDYIVPTCNKFSRGLKTFAINQQNLPAVDENFIYKQFDDNKQLKRLFYVASFKGNRLGYSTLIDLTHPETLQVTQAKSGVWKQQSIELENASVYTVSSTQKLSNTTHAERLELRHFIRPQQTINEYKPAEQSFLKLRKWIKNQVKNGKNISPDVYVTLWEKLTIPLSSLPLVFIAIPLTIYSPRRLVNIGFPAAIITLFTYYVIRHIAVQLGENSVLPPLVAAVLPLAILTTVGIILFKRKNRVL